MNPRRGDSAGAGNQPTNKEINHVRSLLPQGGRRYRLHADITKASAVVFERGDRVYWDASANTAINENDAAADDYLLGVCTAAAASGALLVQTELNAGNIDAIAPAAWQDKVITEVTANVTLDAEDVGKVMVVSADAKTVTLPATAAGLEYVIANGGADGAVAVTVSPNVSDKIMGADLAGVDNKDRINTKATAKRGDYLVLRADGVDGWFVVAERGTWAAEA